MPHNTEDEVGGQNTFYNVTVILDYITPAGGTNSEDASVYAFPPELQYFKYIKTLKHDLRQLTRISHFEIMQYVQ
jgi:hypothetical protein